MNKGSAGEFNILICGATEESINFLKDFLKEQAQIIESCSHADQLEAMAKALEPCVVIMLWPEGKPEWIQALKVFQQKKRNDSYLLMVVPPSSEALKTAKDLAAQEVILYPFQKEELFIRLSNLLNQLGLQHRLNAAEGSALQKVAEVEAKFYGLVGRLAHDLNSPLGAAYMSCDLLTAQPELSAFQQRTLEQIYFSLAELKRTLMALGDWVRLMQGQLKPSIKPVKWQELLEVKKSEWEELESLARREQKKIQVEAQSQLPSALADKELIGRTMILLLHNSLRYTSKGDQIKLKVTVDEEKENLLFCVEDSGQNMPASLSEMIFEWGTSREEHLKGLRWGRGVGLNFCKQAVEACSGKIWAESLEERGCRFYLSLPLSLERGKGI